MRVDERFEGPELGEIADEILAPVAAADDGHADIVSHGLRPRSFFARIDAADQALTTRSAATPALTQALRVSTTTLAPSTRAA